METFYCPQILLLEGWAENRVIAYRHGGFILELAQ